MKINPIPEILSSFRSNLSNHALLQKYADEKPPLRSELYSAEQMERYGEVLAKSHKLLMGRASNNLLKRLSENEELLLDVHHLLTDAVKTNRRIIPAGEWLLDNFYLIQEQIRIGKKHLPKGYSEDLPRLAGEALNGLPRVYDIAIQIISHSDGRVDSKILSGFIQAYQTQNSLKLGELWAIPIMIRLALIENLRRLSTQIAQDRINQNLADYWADQMTRMAEKDPKGLILIIADMARSQPPLVSSFVAELSRHLQGKGPALALPLNWIEQVLSENGQTREELIFIEIQKQAADQVSMSNSIGSLRFLGTMDWQEFVESLSLVEKILRQDISGIYPKMDFSTRDQYRHVIEKMSKNSDWNEEDLADLITHKAITASEKFRLDDRRAHIGYYLIGKGKSAIEQEVKVHFKFNERIINIILSGPLLFYISFIFILTLGLSSILFFRALLKGIEIKGMVFISILCLISVSHMAVTLINWLITHFIKPKVLPRMDFTKGIQPESRSLVVIPSLLTGLKEIENLVESLEVHYLANKDPYLHFGLLTDLTDSKSEVNAEDATLLDFTKQKIEELIQKYDTQNSGIFYWLHRPRKWNPKENKWMGYERKRGKLTEMNDFFRGGSDDSFSQVLGRRDLMGSIKYVITLDTDTKLPRDSAGKMVASMAHPLNKARYDEKKQRVVEGYGILQPRVAMSLTGAYNSLFARLQGNDLGIDPYSRSASDVYQDLFEEGSFIGKGIYDLDIFRMVLDNKFPENRILSHDLLEGCYLRSGLLSDVDLYEEYPSQYSSDVKRRNRWVRGDWQIAAWCLPWVPQLGKGLHTNPLTALSKWKIFDNLRRSLVPISLILLLLSGWTFLHDAWFWTLTISGLLILPSLVIATKDLLNKPKEILLRQHFEDSIHSIIDEILQNIFLITCLPYEAYYTLGAIFKTLWRILISQKNLLEWSPSSNFKQKIGKGLKGTYINMFISPVLGGLGLIYLTFYSPYDHLIADPILLLWIISPFLAWYLSRPLINKQVNLNQGQIDFLFRISRKTWAYFDFFINENENWLPPDNYQEHPVATIAHRTSPTNIGISLLCNLAASDFGYITLNGFLTRTSNTFATMNKMERYKGHFFNWYNTLSLLPLPPRYISTVDSGNLTGHLLTLRQGIREKISLPIIQIRSFLGIKDTLNICKVNRDAGAIEPFEKSLNKILSNKALAVDTLWEELPNLHREAEVLANHFTKNNENRVAIDFHHLVEQCEALEKELNLYFPKIHSDQVPEIFKELWDVYPSASLLQVSKFYQENLALYRALEKEFTDPENKEKVEFYLEKVRDCSKNASRTIEWIENLEKEAVKFSLTEYDFLYDPSQDLFSIGYDVDEHRRDLGFYDLLASESRLGTFVAISQGKIPQESWFSLGRQLTNAGGTSVLLSWSGSMFEYLMPLLVMPTYQNTILDQTCHSMVDRQIEYGKQLGVPWGISESGYNLVDTSLNYQYRAFGVPELGLKRGLGEDLVIAPYATVMALMVNPKEACRNMEILSENDLEGSFGFYEAIDYTPSRIPRGQNSVTIRSFMAHHNGMSLLSLDYYLMDKPMQKRFEAEPQFQASLLLLQERIPKAIKFFSPPPDVADISIGTDHAEMRIIKISDTVIPEVQLLSNGNYQVMVTNAGGGYSRWKNIALTRWREDSTLDAYGTFCYIKDLERGNFWSSGHHPSLVEATQFEAIFLQGRAEFKRNDYEIESRSEIVVSPEDDIEIRRLHLTNRSRKPRFIEITTYAEVVLASAISDALHPAFSNLFVETEILPEKNAILCTRRPRTNDEKNIWFFHILKTNSKNVLEVSYETDRMQFIGRGQNLVNPLVMNQDHPLSGTQGPVLDPIVAIQVRIQINSQESVLVDRIYGVGETREQAIELIDKYQDPSFIDRAFELAWTHNQVVLRQINATDTDAQLYEKLAGSILYANISLRADPAILLRNQRGQSGLWGYSISGDLPIVLLRISDQANIPLVKQVVQAHAYWRLKGLMVDLVIWNEEYSGYRQGLQNIILALINDGIDKEITERPGGIFVRILEQIAQEDRILIQTVARIEISDLNGTLNYQAGKRVIPKTIIPNLIPIPVEYPIIQGSLSMPELVCNNGLGGFSKDGKEYIIRTSENQETPLPWVNVLANADFGTVISESGQAYTWGLNAHEFRLTPWNNDAVTDSSGEAFYIRDDENGHYWSPSSLPARGTGDYITRHGFGYSVFEHDQEGIHSEMTVFVDMEESVKFSKIKVKNHSGRARKISITGYVQWVLGDLPSKTGMHILTEMEEETGCILARNLYNKEFNDHRVCFFDISENNRTYTGDRTEFIGRNRSLTKPEAMGKTRLSGRIGAALDPCGALQSSIHLEEGTEYEIIFLLGTQHNVELAKNLVLRFRNKVEVNEAFKKVTSFWKKTLETIQIESEDSGLNFLGNGWLFYQTLSCRFWARSGFSQSGGAFGFRDQLQDSMALVNVLPSLTREHIVLCASRQFKEGDVQHWWHPPSGRGVRTRCSDDFLWLPLATIRYVQSTGDRSILNEKISFIEGRLLNPEEESYYDQVGISQELDSLYNHCVRAIRNGLRFGTHHLPLMGSGDWNDGMDKVGIEGKGESVWLAFFLYDILMGFKDLSIFQQDPVFADLCLKEADSISKNMESAAWDGEWFRRAYYDNGAPLGSKDSLECKIDSISQSWSVLSGCGPENLSMISLESAYSHLVKKDLSLIQLLEPPFDKTPQNPGYIKGYVPGIRENGGQYTHAAIWLIMAFAKVKNREKVGELFAMINPVNHSDTSEKVQIYKAEPYVVAADVYSDALHPGRGGWTWYTGSAGWMYRLITESILGLVRNGDQLNLDPCIPPNWSPFTVKYRFKETTYILRYLPNGNEEKTLNLLKLRLDGFEMEGVQLKLVNDGKEHQVELTL